MNMSFYTAVVGAKQQQSRLDVHANNIANVNTNGFKAKTPEFQSLVYDSIKGAQDDELMRGTGAYMSAAKTNFESGTLVSTERQLDYAIEGDGFFCIWDPKTGEYTYTRDGSFTKASFQTAITGPDGEEYEAEEDVEDEELEEGEEGEGNNLQTKWYLSDGYGRFVLNSNGGLLEVGETDKKLDIGIFDFINTDGMKNVGGSMFTPIDKNGDVTYGTGNLIQGFLEASNTDLATELTRVIEAQRTYSYALKMIQTSDEIESTVNSLR